ncbi:MAG: hypothetical protein CVV24_13365 [Ignavibacteriae bacterium HGW-Ignavibacteriae-3]|nr:MAG: hypothetical protein CVV24_13365 [Ignavibacteriae bacterium HGW-Ignavibacteriae-3]
MFESEQFGIRSNEFKLTNENDEFPEIIKRELEEVLRILGNDDKSVIIQKKIKIALAALSDNGVDKKKDFRKTLESFSENLERIIKEWD